MPPESNINHEFRNSVIAAKAYGTNQLFTLMQVLEQRRRATDWNEEGELLENYISNCNAQIKDILGLK